MLGHRLRSHLELVADFGGTELASAREQLHYPAPVRLGQGMEGVHGNTVNHTLN